MDPTNVPVDGDNERCWFDCVCSRSELFIRPLRVQRYSSEQWYNECLIMFDYNVDHTHWDRIFR